MDWIATNIRFPKDQYMKLKHKAVEKRKSLAAVVREAAGSAIKPENDTLPARKGTRGFARAGSDDFFASAYVPVLEGRGTGGFKNKTQKKMTAKEIRKFTREIDKLAEENSKYLPKGFDSVKALREIRYGE